MRLQRIPQRVSNCLLVPHIAVRDQTGQLVANSFRPVDEFTRPKNGFPQVCLFWGKENFVLPAAPGEKLCQGLQPDQAEWVDGCGHLPMREKPEEINQKIEKFLTIQRDAQYWAETAS